MRRILLGVTIVFSMGCRTVGTKFEYKRDIELGKSDRVSVEASYGEPKGKGSSSQNGFSSDYYQYYVKDIWNEQFKELNIEFVNDKVNAFMYNSTWYGDESDFAIEKSTQIVVGSSTKEQVVELFGVPHGNFHLPSNLFSPEFLRAPLAKGAKSCYRYAYAGRTVDGFSRFWIQKVLIVFFNDGGKVVDIYSLNSKH